MREIEDAAKAFDRACRSSDIGLRRRDRRHGLGAAAGHTRYRHLLRIHPHQVDRFVAALANEGLSVDPRDLHDAFVDSSHVSVFDDRSEFYVEGKVARTATEIDKIQSARELDVDGARLRVASPEETVAFQVKFGPPQDLLDATSIMDRQAERLDRRRARQLATRLGVLDRLEELFLSSAEE